MTADRKMGNFVKLFCPSQMILSTFLKNITLWWNSNHLKNKMPTDFLQRLLKFNATNLRDLPKKIEPSHSGLVLSKNIEQSRELRLDP